MLLYNAPVRMGTRPRASSTIDAPVFSMICRISSSSVATSSSVSSSRSSSSIVAWMVMLSSPSAVSTDISSSLVLEGSDVICQGLAVDIELFHDETIVPELDPSHRLLWDPIGHEHLCPYLVALEPLPARVAVRL